MEVGGKWVTTTIKKPKTFSKITRFFASRFNTPKLIIKTIIEPLNARIDDFVNNELANVRGQTAMSFQDDVRNMRESVLKDPKYKGPIDLLTQRVQNYQVEKQMQQIR